MYFKLVGRCLLLFNFIFVVVDEKKNKLRIIHLLTASKVFVFGVFLVHIFLCSDQKKSEYRHFSRSEYKHKIFKKTKISYPLILKRTCDAEKE